MPPRSGKSKGRPKRTRSGSAPSRNGGQLVRTGIALAAAGLLLSGAALATDPHRFSFAYLWGFTFFWTAVLGCLFFVVLQHLTRSIWSVVVRRVAEAFAAHAWWLALLLAPILVFAWHSDSFHLFAWLDPAHARHDPVLQGKSLYLNPTFFTLRAVGFVLLWAVFAWFYASRSLRQDHKRCDNDASLAMRRWSPAFMVVFAITLTFASFDWLMSLNPHWFSTIFGVYVFAGMGVTALALVTIGSLHLRRIGRLDSARLRPDHLYPLGALLFGMSCFWAYIAFSQFMLMWYGNLPEETVFFSARLRGGWQVVSIALPLLRFGLPFAVLIGRRAKTHPVTLAVVSGLVLLGEGLDLYWLIMPTLHASTPVLGWPEVGPMLFVVGLLLVLWTRFLQRHSPVAAGDPLWERSRQFHL